jgi:hypothetical protein
LITFTCQTARCVQPQLRDLAAHAREFYPDVLTPKFRGRRECRALNAPAASRAKVKKHTSVVTTVTPVHPAFPTQWF